MSGPTFAPHADVRVIVQDLHKMQSGLAAIGLQSPALIAAMDMLERMSWRIHTMEANPSALSQEGGA